MFHVSSRARAGLPARLLLALVVLAGCQSAGPDAGPADSGPPLTAVALDLLTRSGSYLSQSMLVTRAEQMSIKDCMAAKGFDYRADHGAATPQPPSEDERVVNMADRERNGYGLTAQGDADASGTDSKPAATPPGPYTLALDGEDSERRRYQFPGGGELGISTTGCTAEAHAALYGGDLANYAAVAVVPQRLNMSLSKPVQADAAFAALMRQWSECMSAGGYEGYTAPEDATADLAEEYAGTPPTAAMREREIAVAVADGRCALRLRLPTQILDLRKRHAAALPAADREQLRAATDLWLAAVRRAGDLVNTP